MAGSSHQAIRNAVHAVLAAAPSIADGGVHKGRRRPMAEQFSRQVHVYLDTAQVERAQYGAQPDDWMPRLRIECAGRTVDGMDGGDVADDLATTCYGRLMADPSIGGLLIDLIPLGMAWDTEEGNDQVGVTQLAFDAKHRTAASSIAA